MQNYCACPMHVIYTMGLADSAAPFHIHVHLTFISADHRLCTGIRASNCKLLFVGVI